MVASFVRLLAPILGEDPLSVFLACAPSWAVGSWLMFVLGGVVMVVAMCVRYRRDGRLCTAIAVGGTALLVLVAGLLVLVAVPVLVG